MKTQIYIASTIMTSITVGINLLSIITIGNTLLRITFLFLSSLWLAYNIYKLLLIYKFESK